MLQSFNPKSERPKSRGANRVPMTPFLKSKAIDPDLTHAMGMAFEKTCRTLGLAPTNDPATEAVARVIIDLTEAGERDPELLYHRALAHFGKTDGLSESHVQNVLSLHTLAHILIGEPASTSPEYAVIGAYSYWRTGVHFAGNMRLRRGFEQDLA